MSEGTKYSAGIIAAKDAHISALTAENERLKDLCQRWNVTAGHFAAGSEFINDPERVLEALKAREEGRRRLSEVKERKHAEEVERLRDALKQVEWCQDARYPNGELLASLCPLCDQVKEKGHAPDCLVGAALGRQV